MSDHEQIAQVAHQKWVNEWIASFFLRIAHSLIFGQKPSDLLGKPMSEFPALPMTPVTEVADVIVLAAMTPVTEVSDAL